MALMVDVDEIIMACVITRRWSFRMLVSKVGISKDYQPSLAGINFFMFEFF